MVKIVVNPGRKVWDRDKHRDAVGGDVLDVKDVHAKILKYRGIASDAPARQTEPAPTPTPAPSTPEPTPAPSTPAPPAEPPASPQPSPAAPRPAAPPPAAPPAREAQATTEEEGPLTRGRTYRRRDLRAEN